MTGPTGELVLADLAQLELSELDELGEQNSGIVRIEKPHVDKDRHGELLTATAIVMLTVSGLKVLASWLSKTRKKETIEIDVTVRRGDVEEVRRVRWTRKESSAPTPDQLKALSDMLKIDVSALQA